MGRFRLRGPAGEPMPERPGAGAVPSRRARPDAVGPMSRGAACPDEPPTKAGQSQARCTASDLTPIQMDGSPAHDRRPNMIQAKFALISLSRHPAGLQISRAEPAPVGTISRGLRFEIEEYYNCTFRGGRLSVACLHSAKPMGSRMSVSRQAH
jgi:hypothetical protein